MRSLRLLPVAALLVLASCATVRQVSVRPDYEQVDRTRTLRLAVVTAPLPDGSESVGRLWSRIARKYVNDKRDFIVKQDLAAAGLAATLCVEGLDGILHLAPEVRRSGRGVDAAVKARLFRCGDGETVWTAEAGGSWPSDDEKLRETTAYYVEQLGPEVGPYVAPTFQLLRATLDTLPMPRLEGDEAVMEKIEYAE